jgi:hypothetical protein
MKIILDEVTKEGKLVKADGTVISSYSFRNLVNDEFTIDDLKRDIEKFNVTLGQQAEFDNIKDLANVVTIHNWD